MGDDRATETDRTRIEHVFVLRLWREPGAAFGGVRGTVLEVMSDRRFAFSSLADLADYLHLRLDRTP
jgi:hypothetical protein